MNVLDLFSGIGGFSLGLERAGMRTVAFCEIDPYCRKVLAKHWPDVPVFNDVCKINAQRLDDTLRDADRTIDVICGGFPCQDISLAGKGAGITGERSGLWKEYARIIGEVRPRYVIVENVAALLSRGLGDVLGDLAALGYDAEWHCIPASAVGAPHRRDRIWIIAYANRDGQHVGTINAEMAGASQFVADSDDTRLERWLGASLQECAEQRFAGARDSSGIGINWLSEPDVGRVAYGIPSRVDRLKALGNAVVPQIPEIIGRAIMSVGGKQ